MVRVGGIENSVLQLAEKLPATYSFLPADGWDEKVKWLFPERAFEIKKEAKDTSRGKSIVDWSRELKYQDRMMDSFSKLPQKSKIIRWVEDRDIGIFPNTYSQLVGQFLNRKLTPSSQFFAFWMMSNRFLMKWSLQEDLKANFEFPLMSEILFKNHAPDYYKLPVEAAPHLENKYVFYTDPYNDMLVEFHGEGVCSFFLLYLEADDYEIHHITDDFDWLITQLLNTRGMYWWNYFLVFQASASDQRYLKFHRQMTEYFPDADMSRYPDPADF